VRGPWRNCPGWPARPGPGPGHRGPGQPTGAPRGCPRRAGRLALVRAALDPVLRNRLVGAQGSALAALRSDRHDLLLEDLVRGSTEPPTTELAEQPSGIVLPALAEKAWKRLGRAVRGQPRCTWPRCTWPGCTWPGCTCRRLASGPDPRQACPLRRRVHRAGAGNAGQATGKATGRRDRGPGRVAGCQGRRGPDSRGQHARGHQTQTAACPRPTERPAGRSGAVHAQGVRGPVAFGPACGRATGWA
jgi:hypothetical protein